MFILKDNSVVVDPKMLFIPEFKKIWERDTSKNKKKASKEFAYIYFMADYKSEYNIYGIEKTAAIAEDIMEDQFYMPDKDVEKAIEKYERLQESTSMRYLKSVRETVNSLMKFYDELRFKSKTTNVLDYDPKQVITAMKDIETVIEKIEKWEKKIKSEEESMTIRGGGIIGIFEDPEKATWMKSR